MYICLAGGSRRRSRDGSRKVDPQKNCIVFDVLAFFTKKEVGFRVRGQRKNLCLIVLYRMLSESFQLDSWMSRKVHLKVVDSKIYIVGV